MGDMKFEDVKLGEEVMVYDRYRFAIPLLGEVIKKSSSNDGVEIRLHQSNGSSYPIDSFVWVHAQQLVKTTKDEA